jgi:ABC-type Na+ efflux pump permease subunit
MRFVWVAALKDLRRHRRDLPALALWASFPLLIGASILVATGGRGGSAAPTAHLLVVDQDCSFLSELLVRALGQDRPGGGPPIRAETAELETGRARIENGEATALLVIPEGFGRAVLEEQPTKLRLLTNPAQRILPGIVEETLGLLGEGVFYAHRLVGPELREIVEESRSGEAPGVGDVVRISVAIHGSVERIRKYLLPPALRLETSVDEEAAGENVPVSVLFLPGIVLMAVVFTAQGLSEDVWREKRQATLRRAVSAPQGVVALFAGKLVAGAAVMLGCNGIVLLAGMLYLDLPLARLPLALVWSTFAGTVFFVLLGLVQLVASSQRRGTVLAMSFLFPLLMLGGSFFPSELMPAWMAAIGRWTPNGFVLEQLKDILLGREAAAGLARAGAILLACGAAGFALAARRFGGGFARG